MNAERRIPIVLVVVSLALALLLPTSSWAQTEPARLSDVTVTPHPDSVTVFVKTSREPQYKADLVDSPNRLVIDLDRRVLERRRVILVCDGISPEEGRDFGFVHCTSSFDEAMAMALADRGQDARIATNINADPITEPPGRPVSWRAMPWREG